GCRPAPPPVEREVAGQGEGHRQAIVDVDGADEVTRLPLEGEPTGQAGRPHAEGLGEDRPLPAARAPQPPDPAQDSATVHADPSRPIIHGRASSTRPPRSPTRRARWGRSTGPRGRAARTGASGPGRGW